MDGDRSRGQRRPPLVIARRELSDARRKRSLHKDEELRKLLQGWEFTWLLVYSLIKALTETKLAPTDASKETREIKFSYMLDLPWIKIDHSQCFSFPAANQLVANHWQSDEDRLEIYLISSLQLKGIDWDKSRHYRCIQRDKENKIIVYVRLTLDQNRSQAMFQFPGL